MVKRIIGSITGSFSFIVTAGWLKCPGYFDFYIWIAMIAAICSSIWSRFLRRIKSINRNRGKRYISHNVNQNLGSNFSYDPCFYQKRDIRKSSFIKVKYIIYSRSYFLFITVQLFQDVIA